MVKKTLIQWLEEETGENLTDPAPTVDSRHISVRFPIELADQLAVMAAEEKSTVSTLIRRLVTDAMARREAVSGKSDLLLADELVRIATALRARNSNAA